uniref:GRF-type domain-containing protein n=1 Tax=Brassica oleracea var. oleracea TaxID=109376 RepID=A0A0D3DKJ1_BRAOL
MVRMAGNTSPWEDSTMLTSVARFNAEITYESLLVHVDSRNASKAHNSATYEKDKWSSSRAQHLPAGFTTLTNSKSWRNQKRSSWKYCMHTRQPLRGGYNALEYLSNSIGVVPRKEPCPSAGNHAALPPAKELEKMLPRHQGALVFISFIHLEQMGVKEAGKHMFPLQFIQKKKPNLWVLGFSFKVPVPRFRIPGSGSLAVHLTRRTPGIPIKCWCGESIKELISKTNLNPYCRYYRCRYAAQRKLENDNHIFKWVDEAFTDEIQCGNRNSHRRF